MKAVRLGRRNYDNLRKATAFILAVHMPIAGLALAPLAFGLPVLFGPIGPRLRPRPHLRGFARSFAGRFAGFVDAGRLAASRRASVDAAIDNIAVPSTSRFLGAFGLV